MKINLEHTEKVQDAIAKAQSGSRARRLDADDLTHAAGAAEKQLTALKIPQKSRTGCIVYLQPEKPANSYRGIAHGTYATLIRSTSGWFLTDVRRAMVGTQSYGREERQYLILSDEAHANIPRSFEL